MASELDERARTLLGVLIERLGGSVTITESEINKSAAANGGTFYVEVHADHVVFEVLPRGYAGAPR
jgi:hypothetical protein